MPNRGKWDETNRNGTKDCRSTNDTTPRDHEGLRVRTIQLGNYLT